MTSWLAKMQGVGGVVVSSLLFAGMAVLARVASRHMGTGELCVIRLGVGVAAMLAVFVARRELPATHRPVLLALRGIVGGIAVVLYFLAIKLLPVGPAALLNNLAPVFAAIFAGVFLGEVPGWNVVGGLLVATVGGGLVVASTVPAGQPFHFGLGAVCGLVSAVLSGAALTVIRALRQRNVDERSVFFSFGLIGTLISAPLAVADWHPVAPWVIGCAVGVGILSVAAQLLLTYALRYVPTASGSAASQLTPAFSYLIAVAVLGESISPLGFVGAAICVGGVLLAAGKGARRAPVAVQAFPEHPPIARPSLAA